VNRDQVHQKAVLLFASVHRHCLKSEVKKKKPGGGVHVVLIDSGVCFLLTFDAIKSKATVWNAH
jgi:hypothetical protein